jgi:predicted neutral ceramidase superfamily lipid hydrolase
MVYEAIRNPEQKILEDDGDTKFIATVHGCSVHVVCKPIEKGRWLVKTVWIRGEDDGEAYKTHEKAVKYSKYQKPAISKPRQDPSITATSRRSFDILDLLILLALLVIIGGVAYYFLTY